MKPALAGALAAVMAALTGCGPSRQAAAASDPELEREIEQIKAIDHHAHPVRVVAAGEPPDRGFDALPVDNMEPMSEPVNVRAGSPATADAARELYGATDPQLKQRAIKERGAGYPAWVLDKMGVEIMIANRVEMGPSIENGARFRWAAYADALMFPLDTARLKERNSDRKAFFTLEDKLLRAYLETAGLREIPATLGEYLSRVVTPTLERHRQGGAVAEKFEAAYLRSLAFEKVERAAAERVYGQRRALSEAEYKPLQDYLFRYIAAECGRLGMAAHLHSGEGAGAYYDLTGGNPLNMEPVLNDPELRKTNFVLVHGGWPFTRQTGALLTKPNVYVDFSIQTLLLGPSTVAQTLREWLEYVPEKVMFGTDAYPYSEEMGWEESGMVATRNGRKALAIALTQMVRDGEITRARASVLARMVLRENAKKLYGL
jgi:predicted TIM-barrel fold metal-dependent hydrolase